MDSRTARLGTEPVTPLLLKLALPSMVGLLVNNLYVFVDRIFVGHALGAPGLAAMNAAMPIFMLVFAVAILIGRGSSVLYSIALGRRDYREARRIFGCSMLLYLIAAAVITVTGLLLLDPMLEFLKVPDSSRGLGRTYMSIFLLGTVFLLIGFHNNLIRAEGFSQFAMYTQLLGAGLNVVLDYLFIYPFNWGIAGAAWATVISQAVSALWVLAFFARGSSVAKLQWRYFRLYSARLAGKIFYNGCSPFSINISGSIIWTAQNYMIVTHGGELALAAFSVILTVNAILMAPLFGICMGMQPLVGFNTGAGKPGRVLASFYSALAAFAVFAIVPYCFVQAFPHAVFRIFTKDPDLIAIGAYSLRRFLLLMPLGCGTIIVSQYFQGVGRPAVALAIAMLRQLMFQLPLTFILPHFFEYNGVLFSGPIGDTTALLFGILIMRHELKRLKRLSTPGGKEKTF